MWLLIGAPAATPPWRSIHAPAWACFAEEGAAFDFRGDDDGSSSLSVEARRLLERVRGCGKATTSSSLLAVPG